MVIASQAVLVEAQAKALDAEAKARISRQRRAQFAATIAAIRSFLEGK